MFDTQAFRVKSDAEGHFTFPKVPPGKYQLLRVIAQLNARCCMTWRALIVPAVQASQVRRKTGTAFALTPGADLSGSEYVTQCRRHNSLIE